MLHAKKALLLLLALMLMLTCLPATALEAEAPEAPQGQEAVVSCVDEPFIEEEMFFCDDGDSEPFYIDVLPQEEPLTETLSESVLPHNCRVEFSSSGTTTYHYQDKDTCLKKVTYKGYCVLPGCPHPDRTYYAVDTFELSHNLGDRTFDHSDHSLADPNKHVNYYRRSCTRCRSVIQKYSVNAGCSRETGCLVNPVSIEPVVDVM